VSGILAEMRLPQPERQPKWTDVDNPDMLDTHGAPLIFSGSAGKA
jgi:hypothetical protein